ncbi:MAG: glycosyltransferase family 4 protein [Methanomicrobiales archaeon]|nr:glycosyltransferase family 4 protein [Methanomicrobiales archaeon]NYT20481.1 glycosyltransferase family 4 protein [Methanomicrobiales archaeon]
MKVEFYVEDMLFFKYIGCATVAKTLYRQLAAMDGIDVSWKGLPDKADLVHYHTFGPLALINRKMARGKTVLTAHSTPRINLDNIALARFINKQYPKIYRKFEHIITISQPCTEEVTAMVPDIPVTCIPNGVNRTYFQRDDEKRAAFRDLYGIPEDQEVILSVAQLTPRKGLYDFLALSRMFPDKTFVWVGGFPYGALSKDWTRIRRLKRRCGENVIYPGYVDEIVSPYSAADVFFMPSFAETFGLVILEALSCGLPVIARDIPEFHDIFGDRILYFRSRDEAAGCINDPARLASCASGSRAFTEQFDIVDIAQRHLALYRELVDA